jgi:hypothetical protein
MMGRTLRIIFFARQIFRGSPPVIPMASVDPGSTLLPGMLYYPSDCSPQLAPTSVETQRGGGEIGRRTSLRC